MIKTKCLPMEYWLGKIATGKPFTFVRYGDGEWNSVVWTSRKKGGGRTKNGDGHTLRNKKMRRQMIKSILRPGNDPNYYRTAWMDGDCQPMEILARRWIPEQASHITWYNALAIHFANISGDAFPYFKLMRNLNMPLVIIGPRHLRKLPQAGVFDYQGFVEVPYRRAYFAQERIIQEALEFPEPCLYSIHAGPPSPVFAYRLWKARGNTCQVLDLGSILDGYCGARTRKFWKKRATKQIMRRNLTGR